MATTAADPPVYRSHQDGLLPGTRVGAGPASYSAGSYYTPAPVGPAPRWPKHASFYPLDKPRRQAKPAGAREAAKPALRSKPSQKNAASQPSKLPPSMRRAPTASIEDLDLPSTPSPRATTANDLFSDSTNSRDSSTPSPTPASPPAQPKPALHQAPPTITASGSSSFTSSRRLSLEGSPANILFPHQSFSTTYSSRSHDSYLNPHLSTTASSASASRLPKRVSFAVNLESPLTRTPAPSPQPSQLSAAAPAPHRRASPPPPCQPHLHTSLRACRHRTCTACTPAAATKQQAPEPAATKQQAPEPAAIKQQAPKPATAYPAAVQQLMQQLDSICSSYSASSSSSSLTDPASAAANPTPRGPPTPPLEIEDASYENPTFADSEEIFHTPRSVDEAPQLAPHKQATGPLTRSSSAAIHRPDSPVLPMPILTPSLSLNPLHRPTATSVGRPAGPMAPHHLPVTSDQTVPRHPALFSGSRPRAAADAPPTPATAPATPAEPSTPRTATTATPLASPKRSPMRSLQARLTALATAPVAAISSMGAAASPRTPATPRSPHIEPTSLSADAAAAKPSLSLRARLQMPSTFLRTHSGLATTPATPPSKPPPAKASSKASVLQSLNENGYERQKSGWGLLMWDSSAAVTRKPSAAQHSLFGFEAAMLAEIQAQKAREAEEAYKVGPANSIIGSCGGWKETEAAQQRAALKVEAAAPGAGAARPEPTAGAGFVNLGATPGTAKTVAPFGCFMPFVRSKKSSKVGEIR